MRPADAAGYWEAWDVLERLWTETVERAQRLSPALLHERLAERTVPVEGPGYPESAGYGVVECLSCILGEEWEHRLYAERDLAILESR